MWNGKWGAPMIHVPNDRQDTVFSFVRHDDGNKVFAAFNFSDAPQTVRFEGALYPGSYVDWFAGQPERLGENHEWVMEPWSYRVLVSSPAPQD